MKCIKRHNILRDPTPTPVPVDEEDGASRLLKERTHQSMARCRYDDIDIEPALEARLDENFALSLGLLSQDSVAKKSTLLLDFDPHWGRGNPEP